MTAEIAIMNRYGVALAADSAVSIRRGDQAKVYNTVNKLFALSKEAPVGVMVYGNALLSGIPWETVIKSFRQYLGSDRQQLLSDYAGRMINFIENNPSLLSPDQEEEVFGTSCFELYSQILSSFAEVAQDRAETEGQITVTAAAALLDELVKANLERCRSAPALDDLPEDYGARLVERFSETASTISDHVFESAPMLPETNTLLAELTACFLERPPVGTGDSAGLVIAGFGESEFLPHLEEFEVLGVMGGVLRRRRKPHRCVSAEMSSAVIPFAQHEMVNLFMSGIDPQLRDAIDAALGSLVGGLAASTQPQDGTRSVESEVLESLLETFRTGIAGYIQDNHVEPIFAAVESLPKEELAVMAETLVNLTSIKRRVTLDAETVGGPIDVAIISKGDGLVWIERKHYFRPDLNHSFFANYHRSSPEPQEQS